MNREARRNINRVLRSGLSPRQHSPLTPKQEAAFTHEIRRQIVSLETDAGLHAWTGEDVDRILHYIGRLVFMSLFAAVRWSPRLTHRPEFTSVRGLATSLSMLQADAGQLESLRPDIQAGMLEMARLMESLPSLDLAVSSAVHEMQMERLKDHAGNDIWMQIHQVGAMA